MISIRMSEEEFSALRRICVATGARSMSDLAREAMRSLLSGTNQEIAGDATRNEYYAQMRDLEQKAEKLSAEIALFKANHNF
jgi:plasmid stability protein